MPPAVCLIPFLPIEAHIGLPGDHREFVSITWMRWSGNANIAVCMYRADTPDRDREERSGHFHSCSVVRSPAICEIERSGHTLRWYNIGVMPLHLRKNDRYKNQCLPLPIFHALHGKDSNEQSVPQIRKKATIPGFASRSAIDPAVPEGGSRQRLKDCVSWFWNNIFRCSSEYNREPRLVEWAYPHYLTKKWRWLDCRYTQIKDTAPLLPRVKKPVAEERLRNNSRKCTQKNRLSTIPLKFVRACCTWTWTIPGL